ncbi:hypothetical protein AB1K84_04420 [Mesobacillus foraminis]|uniref:Uncharacterized protein n=1 Tax=Mesobacillus foraminis TaxID=279826 RepID=A0A4R2BE17_9BACI|nr:hypothetical protein [Mesobacillus foraminis]TCN24099.1 hypothetical protein EV146_108209 [Mesobacillus foraminis]
MDLARIKKVITSFGVLSTLSSLYAIWFYSNSPMINKLIISLIFIVVVPVGLSLFYLFIKFLLSKYEVTRK